MPGGVLDCFVFDIFTERTNIPKKKFAWAKYFSPLMQPAKGDTEKVRCPEKNKFARLKQLFAESRTP